MTQTQKLKTQNKLGFQGFSPNSPNTIQILNKDDNENKMNMNMNMSANHNFNPNLNISKRDIRFLERALAVSTRSHMMMKHGCVITCNNKFVAEGHNTYRTQFRGRFIGKSCSCHAEMNALHRLLSLKTKVRVNKYCEKGGEATTEPD